MNRILIGKIKDAHGLKGELYALVFSGEVSWSSRLKKASLAIDESSIKTEYEVQKAKPFKDGVILKLSGIEDRNQSEALKGHLVFLENSYLTAQKGEMVYLRELMGYSVIEHEILLGKIIGFSSNGPQDLLVVELLSAKKVEIPFVQQFIKEIDHQLKVIHMDLPQGLLDLD